MTNDFLTLEAAGGIGVLTMERPPGNGITVGFAERMIEMMDRVAGDRGVRCLVVRSAFSKYFMVGADLKEFPPDLDLSGIDYDQPPDKVFAETFARVTPHWQNILKAAQSMMNSVAALPKPVVASIGGHALGGGCEFALACDFRVMSRGHATVGLTETTLGLIPAGGGTQRLPDVVGLARARELILTGMRLGADEAQAIGLITTAVDPERLEEETLALAGTLASGATRALGCAKRLLNRRRDMTLEEGLDLERECIDELSGTADMLEGVASFVQGRKPSYTGA
ncbi:MAG: enoyl-CoA hydratase/isomerase family protein [Actinobacteria bacterium]|nr:enoyl-CoA hydratase/isomerase family protein [Actinomycetota bacterium]MBU1943009.1 enoyl-CoA hydratase/isomerase family protein [Actinomycetota bacterium]MBU2687751.1 enoyl-CoA hydratase/isomerase family protein [Actinomycetota bacterium]